MENIKYINIDQQKLLGTNFPLFKILPMEKALSSLGYKKDAKAKVYARNLSTQYLWFSNPEKWKDPFERRFFCAEYKSKSGTSRFPLKGRVWATCFSIVRTMEAQWIQYSAQEIGVRFLFATSTLLESITDFAQKNNMEVYVGLVSYHPQKVLEKSCKNKDLEQALGQPFDIENRDWQISTFFAKRNAYEYENELRILLVIKDGYELSQALQKDADKGLKVPLKKGSISKVTLPPSLGELTTALLKDAFRKVLKVPVEASQLYNEKHGNHIFKI